MNNTDKLLRAFKVTALIVISPLLALVMVIFCAVCSVIGFGLFINEVYKENNN